MSFQSANHTPKVPNSTENLLHKNHRVNQCRYIIKNNKKSHIDAVVQKFKIALKNTIINFPKNT